MTERNNKRKNLDRRINRTRKGMMKRGYDGANGGRLSNDWLSILSAADVSIQADLPKLRARSRDLARNNDYFVRFLNILSSNVVGPQGFTLQVQAMNPNGDMDIAGNNMIEADWRAWGMDADTAGYLCLTDMCRVLIETVATDGEFLALHVDGADNPDRYRLQILDPDLLDFYRTEKWSNGNQIRMGVELNQAGRPVAYHILQEHPNDLTYVSGGRNYMRIPADRVIHKFIVRRPNQHRGIPWVAPGMNRLKNIAGYEEAEIINKRTASAKMGFFTRNQDGFGYEGETEDDGSTVMEVEPGVFDHLPPGVDFKAFDPTSDGTSYAEFMKSMLRGVASGLNLSYHTLSSDLESVSFSSARVGTIEERQTWMQLQNWIVDHFLTPVYRRWLRNHLAFNSGIAITKFDKFAAHKFQPRRWQWVDPIKDMQAATMAIEYGLKSRADIIREMGGDPEKTWIEIAKENKTLTESGVLAVSDESTESPDTTNEPEAEAEE